MLEKIHCSLIRFSNTQLFFVCFLILPVIASIDYLTGFEVSVSIVYLIPVFIASWYANSRLGLLIAITAAFTSLSMDLYSGHTFRIILIPFWNMGVKLGFFLITVYLLSRIRFYLNKEQRLARIDFLTGAMNIRGFEEEAKAVMAMALRHNIQLTLAYIDVDNFKYINDTHGHSEGDRLLRLVAQVLKQSLRGYDVVARLGGDEFALLFPMTDFTSSDKIITRIRTVLSALTFRNGCSVTFSIGVVTFETLPKSIEESIKIADRLMYQVKHAGKDNMIHQIWRDSQLL